MIPNSILLVTRGTDWRSGFNGITFCYKAIYWIIRFDTSLICHCIWYTERFCRTLPNYKLHNVLGVVQQIDQIITLGFVWKLYFTGCWKLLIAHHYVHCTFPPLRNSWDALLCFECFTCSINLKSGLKNHIQVIWQEIVRDVVENDISHSLADRIFLTWVDDLTCISHLLGSC
jgi:hypothetical protein